MSISSRRIVSILLVALVLGAATLGTRYQQTTVRDLANAEASWKSRQVLQNAQNELNIRLREMEVRASAAASLNPIRALAAQRVDRATLKDAFGTEKWWRSYREDFPVQFLSRGTDLFDLSRDKAAQELRLGPLISSAIAKSTASGFLVADKRPFLVSAASIDVPVGNPPQPSCLVLAKPLTKEDLFVVSERLASALVLSYEKNPLIGAGPSEQQERIRSAVGREAEAPILSPDRTWMATCRELTAGLFLWAYVDTTRIAQQAKWSSAALIIPLFLSAAIVAALLFLTGFQRPRSGGR